MDGLYSFVLPLRSVISLPLFNRLLELGGLTVLLLQQSARHRIPQSPTFSRQLVLQRSYGLGYRVKSRDVDQRSPLVFSPRRQVRTRSGSRWNRRALAGRWCPPVGEPVANATLPRAIEMDDDSIGRDMFDLCPFLVFCFALLVGVDNSFQCEHRPPDPRLRNLLLAKGPPGDRSHLTSSLYSMIAR